MHASCKALLVLLILLSGGRPVVAWSGAPEQAEERKRAIFYEKLPGKVGTALEGLVRWSVAGPLTCPKSMLASLDFQDKAPGAVITVRGGHPDVKPSLVIDVHLAGTPRSFDVAEVVAMPGLVLKPTESARGKPLYARSINLTQGAFRFVTATAAMLRQSNAAAIAEGNWIDLPVQLAQRHVLMTFEVSGEARLGLRSLVSRCEPAATDTL